jgi:hypothetical protein
VIVLKMWMTKDYSTYFIAISFNFVSVATMRINFFIIMKTSVIFARILFSLKLSLLIYLIQIFVCISL